MLKSPSIQIFEKASTPSATPITGAGMATVGFSTMGPINKLMRFDSYSEFERTMGKPVSDYPFAHMMAYKVLSGGYGSAYFIRAGQDTAEKSTVLVSNHDPINPVRAFYAASAVDASDTTVSVVEPYFAIGSDESVETLEREISFVFAIGEEATTISQTFTFRKVDLIPVGGGDLISKFAVHLDVIVARFNGLSSFIQNAKLKSSLNGTNGLYIEGKNYSAGSTIALSVEEEVIEADRLLEDDSTFGEYLNDSPTGTEEGSTTFFIESKYAGSGYNGYYVRKYDYNNPLTSASDTFTVEVYTGAGVLLETFAELTISTFVDVINSGSDFIVISAETAPEEFVDGTYVLGNGELLLDGTYGFTDLITEGTDGIPDASSEEEMITTLFSNALSDPSLLNLDSVFFSIISVPDSQNSLVQDAAITVARTRGDAVAVIDVPLDYSIDKSTISSAVSWHNGGAGLRGTAVESSYAIIYYGWTFVGNVYGTGNLLVPPSVQMVSKLLAIDALDGSYYAPAGPSRGNVVASDYIYSPDQSDRELMMGDINCINPIVYSNTRGLLAWGQKTADRTNSPLNRINIRRMVNEIKRRIYSRLDVVRFELNNAATQERARKIVSDIFFNYKSAGAISYYAVSASSPGGSEKDVLNVYIEFIPVGLIERIRVYLSIDEAGISLTEVAA